MAVTFATGFEAREAATDGITLTGTAAYSTAQYRTGAASLRCNPASGVTGFLSLPAGNYVHFGLYVSSLPSINRIICGNLGQVGINLRLTSAGALVVYLNNTLIGTSSAAFASSGWHWVGVRQVTGTSVTFLQIDGVDEVTGTATVTYTLGYLGFSQLEASAVDVFFDDVIFDDAGFLAPSKVDIALPISDNSRGNATGGAGGTTNLWDALNNTPPAGAATDTNLTNIKCPASTVVTYVVNLETYTTLGIGASDTIVAVRSVIRHGEDVATGTKNGTLGAVTNPTISDALAFTFGDNAGAHGAEIGLWVSKFGTLTTSPSVTLGTSPTLTVSRASETRVGCVDFMGLLVVWTPAAVVADRPIFLRASLQAVNRAASW